MEFRGRKNLLIFMTDLLEVDLQRLEVVASESFEWSIAALSSAQPGVPLTVGTSLGIHLHDYRARHRQLHERVEQLDDCGDTRLRNFLRHSVEHIFDQKPLPPYAPLSQPTPLSILHLSTAGDGTTISDDIYVAGRFSNILHYDRRKFPSIMDSIYSGASLSTIVGLPCPFSALDTSLRRRGELSPEKIWKSKSQEGGRTLIAGGEYNTKGSLEIYGLYPDTNCLGSDSGKIVPGSAMKNRQTSAPSKILSVINHGTSIVFSDSSGNLKWMERDGLSEIRRHRIGRNEVVNRPSLFASMPGSDELARKILSTQSQNGHSEAIHANNDILFWTGEMLGLVAFTPKTPFKADDFEKKRDRTEQEIRADEDAQRYRDRMRAALERQADEARFVRDLGLNLDDV
jgi:hypothetical protein